MSKTKTMIDQEFIRQLALLLNETDLTEIEVEQDSARIRVARTPAAITHAAPIAAPAPAMAAAPVAAPVETGAKSSSAADSTGGNAIRSPMVGTAYLSSEPGAPPYIKVGDTITEGQTLLIIEAMKTMNQIPATASGVVKEILVSDKQPVEYGEPLVILA